MQKSMNGIERHELDNTMSKRFIWAVAYGSSIGWGAFILPGDWLNSSGTLGATLGITIGGLLMLVIAVAYGALTAKFPVSGGEFAFTYAGFGKYVSFIASWFLVLGYICIVALNASAFSLLFKFVLPDVLEVGYLYTIAGWDVYIMEVKIGRASCRERVWWRVWSRAIRTEIVGCDRMGV